MIIPVVLSGGSGTRLWPLSRGLYPKQLLPLVTEKTMIQETVGRLEGAKHCVAPLIVCNEAHRFLVAEQLRKLDIVPAGIVLEPEGRNTAPAIAVAAMQLLVSDESDAGEMVMLVLPADHVIENEAAFHEAVAIGYSQAVNGKLVTFGIVPHSPETGYGYVKKGPASGNGAFDVDEFVEKPDGATAEEYLASGRYLWNSGMFMFRVDQYLEELGNFAPDIITHCRTAITEAHHDLDFIRLGVEAFLASPS